MEFSADGEGARNVSGVDIRTTFRFIMIGFLQG